MPEGASPPPMKDWYGQEYDPEIGMWVAKSADSMALEMKGHSFRRGILKRRNYRKTIYNQHGKPIAQVHVHDSGNTEHEFDNHQDGVARPDPVHPKPWVQR